MSTKQTSKSSDNSAKDSILQEDEVKRKLLRWLDKEGWQRVSVAMNKQHGADIVVQRDNIQWIIEVKGCGSRRPMRVNYFLAVLGEILQRMSKEHVKYSIAFPDMKQYRDLWEKLPRVAKQRTKISVLFVEKNGRVAELES